MSNQCHVMTVQVYDILAGKFACRVDLYPVVNANHTTDVVVDKTYIM